MGLHREGVVVVVLAMGASTPPLYESPLGDIEGLPGPAEKERRPAGCPGEGVEACCGSVCHAKAGGPSSTRERYAAVLSLREVLSLGGEDRLGRWCGCGRAPSGGGLEERFSVREKDSETEKEREKGVETRTKEEGTGSETGSGARKGRESERENGEKRIRKRTTTTCDTTGRRSGCETGGEPARGPREWHINTRARNQRGRRRNQEGTRKEERGGRGQDKKGKGKRSGRGALERTSET